MLGMHSSGERPRRKKCLDPPMKPPALGPKIIEKPTAKKRRDPIAEPAMVCSSMLNAFFRRMRPAWAIPRNGVCKKTNVVASNINATSPLSIPVALSPTQFGSLLGPEELDIVGVRQP